MTWFKTVLICGIVGALFVQVYFDAKVPEAISERWTVKIIDAYLKTFGHMVSLMSLFGYGDLFSESARKLGDQFALTQMTGSPWGLGEDPELKIHDSLYDGVPVRVYEPVADQAATSRPVVVYFHGGGWSLLSVDAYDPLTRKLAKDTGYVVISVDYRLAPQHPYPAAFDDCVKVVEYILKNSHDLGLNPARIAVAGDSAGGNLAAAVSLRLKEKIRVQILLVPALQVLNFNTTGFIENAPYMSKSINSPENVVFWLNYAGIDLKYLPEFFSNNHTSVELKNSKYAEYANPDKLVPKYYIRTLALRDTELRKDFGNRELWEKIKHRLLDPYLAPLMAGDDMLRRTAHAYVMTAGYDIIRDDGIMYVSRLKAVGSKAMIRNFPEAFHHCMWFHSGPLRVNVGTRVVRDVTNFLKNHL
ncbi:neutral cholesterol ester hydrolase 1-like [Haliotis rufescens]|uniref:neutral cholesterol ester hydrolase 1-like n=1 Tax=Haliotis rufescens TaxID=6454 RepID=UPI001EAFEFC3|nr:neutral cholesterol ester hydrolase 1-like [Haliotis rufescens]